MGKNWMFAELCKNTVVSEVDDHMHYINRCSVLSINSRLKEIPPKKIICHR